jgi:hypothetical protein
MSYAFIWLGGDHHICQSLKTQAQQIPVENYASPCDLSIQRF